MTLTVQNAVQMFCTTSAGALLVALLTPGCAMAQATDAPLASSPADPGAAATDRDALPDIVVTAQRRPENSQRVPITVQTVSGQAIADAGYTQVTDLQYLTPGLQYDPTQGAAFQIRGVGTTSFDFSNAKSVNVVVDDVVMDGQRANGLIGLADIARVDVLEGPQGTLFGKNSTSGVIAVSTTLPQLNVNSLRGSATYGEHNDLILNGTANVALGRNAALRVSGYDQGQDGFGRNVTLNRLVGSSHDYGGRARLFIQANDRFDITLSGDYGHHWDSSVRTPVSGQPDAVTTILNSLGVHPGPKNADTADSEYGTIETEEWGSSVRLHAKIGDNDLTSISAYRYTLYNNNTPADLTPIDRFAYIPYNYGHLYTDKVSEELHFSSPEGRPISYLIGAYYNRLEATQTQLQWATLGAPVYSNGIPTRTLYAITGAIGKSGNTSLFNSVNETEAVFGQLQLNLDRRFRVALGGRYTHDNNSQSLSYIDVDPIAVAGFTPTFVATSAPPVYPFGRVKGDNFSFRVAPEFQITPDIMVYGSYTTGYKPAGIAFVGNKYDPYLSETVKAWEIGLKSEWFGRRLRVNLDAFREDFTNFQATILTNVPDGSGGYLLTAAIGNAGGLRSQGVEGTIALKPTRSLSLTASAAYTDGWFTDYVYNSTTNYTDTRLPNSPDWAVNASADYDHPVSSSLRLRGHADYAYRSSYWTVVGQPSYSFVPSYDLVNARLSVLSSRTGVEVGIYARNLFDTYFSTGWQLYGAVGLLHYTSPDARRTVGGFVNFKF